MYVVGCTNSGKSSFLNALIHKMSNNPRLRDNKEQTVFDREHRSKNEVYRSKKEKDMEGLLQKEKKTSTVI